MLFEKPKTKKEDTQYSWAKPFMKAINNGFWTVEEFNFQNDIQDFKVNLTVAEQEVIKRSLSAISQVETNVKQFWGNIGYHLPHKNLINLGLTMGHNEAIHNEAYETLLLKLDLEEDIDDYTQDTVLAERVTYVGKRAMKSYKDQKKAYIHTLILFTLLIENVSLFSQFYIILWFGRYRNVLKDTNQQVLYTKNEELIHGQIGSKLINTLREEYPELFDADLEAEIIKEVNKGYEMECKLIDWILEGYEGERLNANILKEFVKKRFNTSLTSIGYQPIFTLDQATERDYEWMEEEILGNNQTDFFYKRSVDYSKKAKSFTVKDLGIDDLDLVELGITL